tara:strand:- start:2130 stop:2681 length:552 start_codon:yes stop_codon:yes gene_type:complete
MTTHNAFKVERIINSSEVNTLKGNFSKLTPRLAHQDYNLFDVDKRLIDDYSHPILRKIDKYVNLKPMSHYFVKYGEEGFTSLHTDDDGVVKLTVVTLIEDTDLVGGETLVIDRYMKSSRPSNKYAKRGKMVNAPIGQSKIPVIAKMEVGESVIYDNKVTHGVCQVEKGSRLVLVSWYMAHDEM